MKTRGGLDRNPLKSASGDASQVVLRDKGRNIRLLLKKLLLLFVRISRRLLAQLLAIYPASQILPA
jgi:hypothetical protein